MNVRALARASRHAYARAVAAWPVGARHRCCLCRRRVRRFLPYRHGLGELPAVLRDADVIGSDVVNFECPACGCHDRERHLALYFRATGLTGRMGSLRILHFAPERRLASVIAAAHPVDYVQADLHPSRPGIRCLDLTDIAFPADRVDLVIANHVLEHVDDDIRALSEIRRVLRPGGLAVLQTPFAARLPTKLENRSIASASARLQVYGQEDHVRLYGADLSAFIAAQGFVHRGASHDALLPDVDAGVTGVNAREPFLLFEKPS